MRKLFWSIGGILPVWLVHPGQIVLLVERKLGATLFKGATLPAWWTANVVPTAIFLVGSVMGAVASIGLVFWIVDLVGETVDNDVERLIVIGLLATNIALIVCGAAVSWWLSTIWPWRHLRVAVCTVEDERAACEIAREPCAFEHADGTSAQERFVHWFWGPTLGSRDWKFRFTTHAQVGEETNHSFMVVTDGTDVSMSFTIHEMTDVDSIYPWRGQCLYGANEARDTNWFGLLHGLFVLSSTRHECAKEKTERLSDELHLSRIESEAWRDFVGMLGEYFANGRTTRPDKEIARLLGDASIVMAEHMGEMRRRDKPYSHDEDALRERFEAMNWPSLVSARKRRADGEKAAS